MRSLFRPSALASQRLIFPVLLALAIIIAPFPAKRNGGDHSVSAGNNETLAFSQGQEDSI